MNDRDVTINEMRKFWNISERDIERIIAGQAPDGDETLEDIAMFFKDLDETYSEVSTESHESAHVRAMIQAAQLLADNGEPVVRPASKAYGPESRVSGLPKLRSRIMIQFMLASNRVKAAAAGMAVVLMFGGTAFAGVLPAPVQDAVAGAVETIGIDLPDSDDSQAAEIEGLEVDQNNDIEAEEDSGNVDDSVTGDENDEPDTDGSGRAADIDEQDSDMADDDVDEPDTNEPDDGDIDEPDTNEPDDGDIDEPDTNEPDDGDIDELDSDMADDDADVDEPDADEEDEDSED